MWSPVLTTGWHKQVLFTNQWAAQVHTVWLQPKILWDCKVSFLQHFLFFKRKPLNPILASNVVLSAVERTCLAWIAFPVERSRYKQVAHNSYFLCLLSNECAKCEIPLPIRWQKQKKLHKPHFLARSRESMWSPFLLLAFVFSALVDAAPKEGFIGPEKLIEEESAATTCQTAILRFLS